MLWAERKSCYCAFCKISRKVYREKHLSLIAVVSLVLLGIIFTYALFGHLDARGLGFVGVLLLTGELFSQLRWRSTMICQNCGFDPVLYIRDPEAAGLKIKAFLEKRAERPEFLLKPPVVMTPQKKSSKAEILSLKA